MHSFVNLKIFLAVSDHSLRSVRLREQNNNADNGTTQLLTIMNPYLIAIAGGSGSGKSTLAEKLQTVFPEKIAVLNCDHYYKRHDHLSEEERNALNYDHPDALDWSLLRRQLSDLKNGRKISCPVYDQAIQNRTDAVIEILPEPVIILEGIFALYDSDLRQNFDLKIYIDGDADVRILRRILRDTKKLGRSTEKIITQYLTTVKPMHDAYVAPTRQYADLILNGCDSAPAFDLLREKIAREIKIRAC